MPTSEIFRFVIVGVGATAVLDAWLIVIQQFGVPTLNFSILGRWVGLAVRGQFMQPAIAKAAPIRGETALGWLAHYLIGIAYAAMLFGVMDPAWAQHPSLIPALIVGLCTVAAPLFVMQPAMGAGFAASKTPEPMKSCIRSLINHAVFGVGLYVSAVLAAEVLG